MRRFQPWKQAGYRIEMVYLRLRSAQLAPRRIAARLRRAATMCRGRTSSGGSQEGGETFSALPPVGQQLGCVRQFGPCTTITGEKSVKAKTRTKASRPLSFAAGVGRALRRAAKDAQKTARMYGTPLYVWENGKVVAKKP